MSSRDPRLIPEVESGGAPQDLGGSCHSARDSADNATLVTGTMHLPSGDIYYEISGTGEPLVLVHGGLGSVREWDVLRPYLDRRFQTIAYDRAGVGRSTGVSFRADLVENGAEELGRMLEQLHLSRVHVLGGCVGGAMGLVRAAQRDPRIASVISIGALLTGGADLRDRIGKLLRPWDGMPPAFQQTVSRIQGVADPSGYYERFRSVYVNQIPVGYASDPEFSLSQRLSNMTCPVLLCHGDRDPFWGVEQPVAVYRQLLKGSLCVFPGCGHYPQIDHPEAVAVVALRFLADQSPSAR